MYDLAEFLRFNHVCATINLYLFRYQLLQQFDREVFLLHLGYSLKELWIKQGKLLGYIGEKINDAFALYALTKKRVNPCVHFRQRNFLTLSLIHKTHNKYAY